MHILGTRFQNRVFFPLAESFPQLPWWFPSQCRAQVWKDFGSPSSIELNKALLWSEIVSEVVATFGEDWSTEIYGQLHRRKYLLCNSPRALRHFACGRLFLEDLYRLPLLWGASPSVCTSFCRLDQSCQQRNSIVWSREGTENRRRFRV